MMNKQAGELQMLLLGQVHALVRIAVCVCVRIAV